MSLPLEHSGIGQRSRLPLGGQAAAIVILLFSGAGLWAQAPAPDPSNTKADDGACQQAGRTSPSLSQAESQSNRGSAQADFESSRIPRIRERVVISFEVRVWSARVYCNQSTRKINCNHCGDG